MPVSAVATNYVPRVVHVTRQSRGAEDSLSTSEQEKRLDQWAERDGAVVVASFEERDVSGGKPLAKRPGLSRAVALVESGEADEIRVAYFDRLVRSLKVQEEVLTRVETAGGKIAALDFGEVSGESAVKWLSSTLIGGFNDYWRRATAERTESHKAAAVARGVPPFPRLVLGVRRSTDPETPGKLEEDPETAPLVRQVFEMRASTPPTSIENIRVFLAEQGHPMSFRAVQRLLTSTLLLGEIHFGKYANLHACEPIVNRSLWRRVTAMRAPRGRQAKSVRVLARQGILRCGTCGSKLVLGTNTNRNRHVSYRCGRMQACAHKVSIAADAVEKLVEDQAEQWLRDRHGAASARAELDAAEQAVEEAQGALDNVIDALTGTTAASAKAKIAEFQADLDDKTAARDDLLRTTAPLLRVSFHPATKREQLHLDEWRRLIRLAVESAVVAPGRGPAHERVTITPRQTLAD